MKITISFDSMRLYIIMVAIYYLGKNVVKAFKFHSNNSSYFEITVSLY